MTTVAMASEDTAPSSTPSKQEAVFSDEPSRVSSPPSSPPAFPWELQPQPKAESSPTTSPRRHSSNAFSVLGKRKPLAPLQDNARPKRPRSCPERPLKQMQMSLGQEIQKKCKECGMEYVASSEEDRKLHDKFHKQATEGYELHKDFVAKTNRQKIFNGVKDGDSIVLIDCHDRVARRKHALAVLDIVQKDLGAVPLDEREIWQATEHNVLPKYAAFIYMRANKCVGFLLTQRIREAFRVQEPKRPKHVPPAMHEGKKSALAALKARKEAERESLLRASKEPLSLSTAKVPVLLGISRIWTSPSHRGQEIAGKLLDTAVGYMNAHAGIPEQEVEDDLHSKEDHRSKTRAVIRKIQNKQQVAFSQPTEAGTKLARKWFGKLYGWSVYID